MRTALALPLQEVPRSGPERGGPAVVQEPESSGPGLHYLVDRTGGLSTYKVVTFEEQLDDAPQREPIRTRAVARLARPVATATTPRSLRRRSPVSWERKALPRRHD
jgi:hypothetical protein